MSNYTGDAAVKGNGATTDFKAKMHGAENQIEKMAMNAGEKVGAYASSIADTSANTLRSSREFVKENPVKGVAYAAAAGLVLGGLLTMAFRRSSKD